jgi:hypothetical protein
MHEEEIKKAYAELPQKIRDAIFQSEWEKNLGLIVKKNNFRIDQALEIENSTVMIMLGLISMQDFIEILKNDADIKDPKIIDSLLKDLEESIFGKIREAIMESTKEEIVPAVEVKKEVVVKENNELDRESILKEIEKDEENETEIAIPAQPSVPSTQVNTAEQNQKVIAQDLKNTAPNTVAQKLQAPSVSEPKVVRVDPYRESF